MGQTGEKTAVHFFVWREHIKRVALVTSQCENGADVGARNVNVAICCMVFHELPKAAHGDVLEAMFDSVEEKGGDVWIMDIDPSYQPSIPMLPGEPYVPDYLKEIESNIEEEAKTATRST